MLYYEKNTGERSEYNTWWGLYNTFKSVLCYRLNYSSCVPLGVTDFVRTSSQEKVDGDIYTFFSFIFNSRELQGVLWETDSYMRSPWWGPKACRGSNPTLLLFLFSFWNEHVETIHLCILGWEVVLLLIRSWVLGNEANENRNGALLFYICV